MLKNNLIPFILKKKRDILACLALIIATVVVWFPLTKETIINAGFEYLRDPQQHNFWASFPSSLAGYEASANLVGKALIEIFNVNFVFYFWTEMIMFTIVVISFYVFIKVLTRSFLISFLASLIFSASYFGNFDMLGSHCYCFYTERVVSTPFLLFSLTFLHLFLISSRHKFYFLSFGLFFFGIALSHFVLLFTGPFLFYPFFWFIFQKKKKISRMRSAIKGVVYGSCYVAASGFISLLQYLYQGNLGPGKWTFLEFISDPVKYNYVEKMIRQLAYWSHYSWSVLQNWNAYKLISYIRDEEDIIKMIPVMLIVYFLTFIFIYKNFPKLRAFLLTILLSLTSILFLNAWFGEYRMMDNVGSNRYLYYPTFLLSIFWALVIAGLFKSESTIKKIIALFIITAYLFINQKLIAESFQEEIIGNRPVQKMYDALIKQRETLKEGTLVVGSFPELDGYSAKFFTERMGRGEVLYQTDNSFYVNWRETASTSAHVVRTYYDSNCDCIKEERIK